jgi:hypothetical protein
MKQFSQDCLKNPSRRNFISLSSCGITFGISGYTEKPRINSIQANHNHMNRLKA